MTDLGTFRTHFIPTENETCNETSVLFGIKTVTADVVNGLRINGKTVKLKGGCLHHDNGMLGAVSLYDSELRKLSIMKEIGFNAIRTTHNPLPLRLWRPATVSACISLMKPLMPGGS